MKLGIICRYTAEIQDGEKKDERFYVAKKFIDFAESMGVMLIPIYSDRYISEYLNLCDGLIVPGSYIDVNPKYYNEADNGKTSYQSFDLFKLDKSIILPFYKAGKKILGICAGIQAINVVFGGTLYQDIPNHDLPVKEGHSVKIMPETLLFKIYNAGSKHVNSIHHQNVKDLAAGFTVSAISEDGYIEAIEKENILAVQWHPELMQDYSLLKEFFGFQTD